MNEYYQYQNQMPRVDMNYFNNMTNNAMMNEIMTNQNYLNYPTSNIYDPYQGFLRGNMFPNLYDKYKKYSFYELKPTTEKEKMLKKLQEYDFSLIDLDLYLDIYPNDNEKIMKYNEYLNTRNQLANQYQNTYGPLSLDSSSLNNTPWMWINSPWPWEVQK